MHPLRPTATHPTEAYHSAPTVRADHGVATAEDDSAPANSETRYQQHPPRACVNRRQSGDAEYLNASANRIAPAGRLGWEQVALARQNSVQPSAGSGSGADLARDGAGPSHRDVPSHFAASGPHLTIETIQHYLHRMAHVGAAPRSNESRPSGRDVRATNGIAGAHHRHPLSSTTQPVSRITVKTIRQYLHQKGYSTRSVSAKSIQSRIDSVNLNVAVLLIALQTVHDCNHPILRTLNVSEYEQEALIYRLSGIVINKSGFCQAIRTCLLRANNDPNRLIRSVLQLIRGIAV